MPVHYVEHGEGSPVLALHGAGVDHREVMACLDPVLDALTGYRRIYPDLPGWGAPPLQRRSEVRTTSSTSCWRSSTESSATSRCWSPDTRPAGTTRRRSPTEDRSRWWGWRCCARCWQASTTCPTHEVVVSSGDIGDAEFRDYFTVQTAETLDRYERYVQPAARLADQSALARIGERWELTTDPRNRLHTDAPRCW